MKPIYKICKKFWGPSQDLRSLDPSSLKSEFNAKKTHKKTKNLEINDYDRVVKSSDRGTQGETNILKNIFNNTFDKKN